MGYLVCQRCGGYYKLRDGESPEDFVSCQCYGPLKYVENLEDYVKTKKPLTRRSSDYDEIVAVNGPASNDDIFEVAEKDENRFRTVNQPPEFESDLIPQKQLISDENIKDESDKSNSKSDRYSNLFKEDKSEKSVDSNKYQFAESKSNEKVVADPHLTPNLEQLKPSPPMSRNRPYDDADADEIVIERGVKIEKVVPTSKNSEPEKEDLIDTPESDWIFTVQDLKDLKELKMNKSNSKTPVYSNYHTAQPKIKNRAYYRQTYTGDVKPDIDNYKLYKDVDSLIMSLKYPDPEIQQKTLQALAVVGDEKALKPLEEFIKNESPSLKMYAEIAINQIKSRKFGIQSKNRNDYFDSQSKFHKFNDSQVRNLTKNDIIKKDLLIAGSLKQVDIEKEMDTNINSVETSSDLDSNIDQDNSLQKNSKSSEINSSIELSTELSTESSSVITSATPEDIVPLNGIQSENNDENIAESNYLGRNISKDVLESKNIDNENSEPVDSVVKQVPEVDVSSRNEISQVEPEIAGCSVSEDIAPDNINSDSSSYPKISDSDTEHSGKPQKSNLKGSDVNLEKDVVVPKGTPIRVKKNSSEPSEELNKIQQTPSTIKTNKNSKSNISKQYSDAHKSTNAGLKVEDKTDDIYFIKWLGIKNSDKPIVGFVIIFVLALIIGVILTLNSQ